MLKTKVTITKDGQSLDIKSLAQAVSSNPRNKVFYEGKLARATEIVDSWEYKKLESNLQHIAQLLSEIAIECDKGGYSFDITDDGLNSILQYDPALGFGDPEWSSSSAHC